MGALYLANDPNTNRLVAIKLLDAPLESEEFRLRFVREVRALAALNHPNIVSAYDTGEHEGAPYFVMEFVDGETLSALIRQRAAMNVPQKLKLMTELCAGLRQAHAAGIIHRDIKPANLMVDRQGRLKILDFGIARVVENSMTRVNQPLTLNVTLGTPGYMSPEQIEGREVDRRSDIFSVGAVCHELFSYDVARSGSHAGEIGRHGLPGQPPPLASLVPGLDPEIDRIVSRALSRSPDKRYQDAAALGQALESVRLRLEGAPRPASPFAASPGESDATVIFTPGNKPAPPSPVERTIVSTPAGAAGRAMPSSETVISTPSGAAGRPMASAETIISTPAGATRQPMSSAETILAPPGPGRPPARDEPLPRDTRVPSKRRDPVWTRYRRTALAIAALVIVAVMALLVVGLIKMFGPSGGYQVTITRPTGGTVSAAGIKCGTGGSACSTSRPEGEVIELLPEPDAGFAFESYTGDCAPGGRTRMTEPRTCGATFVPIAVSPPAATQLLTIAPVPSGGTIKGVDIECGSKGAVCSVKHPDGVPVDLYQEADPGYTFMGFEGDCRPMGRTQMTGPRTCSGRFSLTSSLSEGKPLPPAPAKPTAPGGTPSAQSPNTPKPGPAQPPSPPTGPPAQQTGTVDPGPPGADQKPAPPPISDVDFAKQRILQTLTAYCKGDRGARPGWRFRRLFPKANMAGLRRQLNKGKYKSVECKFGEPKYSVVESVIRRQCEGACRIQGRL